MNTTYQYGRSSTGKTVLLAALYEYFGFKFIDKNHLVLNVEENEVQERLLRNIQMIKSQHRFPPGTVRNNIENYVFTVKLWNDERRGLYVVPELEFQIIDYAGGDLSGAEITEELISQWKIADQNLFIMDGFDLLHILQVKSNSDPSLNFGKLRLNLPVSPLDNLDIILRSSNPKGPIAIVITKWDYMKKHIRFEELLDLFYLKFPNLQLAVPDGSLIIPVSSIGDNNTIDTIVEDEEFVDNQKTIFHRLVSVPSGDFEFNPENLHVLMSFIFKRFAENHIKNIITDYDEVSTTSGTSLKMQGRILVQRLIITKINYGIKPDSAIFGIA